MHTLFVSVSVSAFPPGGLLGGEQRNASQDRKRMDGWEPLAFFLLGGLLTGALAYVVFKRWQRDTAKQRERLLDLAVREAEVMVRERQANAELQLEKRRHDLEAGWSDREREVTDRQRASEAREAALAAREAAVSSQAMGLDVQRRDLEEQVEQSQRQQRNYRQRLQGLAGLNQEEIRAALVEEVKRECEEEIRGLKRELLQKSEAELSEQGRRILGDTLQRLSTRAHHDLTATLVTLPSEEMKGRIIGREGRNIKAFESSTGTTLLIDETPQSVLISSFDPVRREVARRALESLMRDGRIHPPAIEEAVATATEEVKQQVRELGEEALQRLRLGRLHPELIAILGRLRYRLTNNQNSLEHSIEVATLAGLLAQELGLDPEPARRAGLLHDLGKVLDQEHEGSHALAAARLIERYGEDAKVVNAVAAHHEEVPATSVYAALLMAADSVSAMRPGARAESMESYIQRVRRLEDLAREFPGIQDAYAVQAGREIRVIVESAKVTDDEARHLARQLRRRIEEDLQYPGSIRVTVVREARFVETAK